MLKHFKTFPSLYVNRFIAHVRIPLHRNAYALMVSTAITAVLGLLYWLLAARFYPADVVGLNAAVVSAMTFLAGIAQHPFMNAVLRFVPVAGRDLRRFVSWCYGISFVFAILVAAIFLLGVNVWSPALGFLRNDLWLAVWFLLSVITWTIFALQDNVLTALREAIYVPLENIPYAVLKAVLLVLFAERFTSYGILASWTLPLIIVSIPVNYLIFQILIPRHMAAANGQLGFSLGQITYYVGGNYLGALFHLAATSLLPVLVANILGTRVTGYFYLPWTIANAFTIIVAVMSASFTVEVVADSSKLRNYSYRFLVSTLGLLTLPILLILLGSSYVLHLAGSDYSAEGATLLRLLTLATIPHVIVSLFIGIARVHQHVARIVSVQFGLCVLHLGLSYYFLRIYGITGVGIAVLSSQTLVAAILLATVLGPLLVAPLPAKLRSKRHS